MNDSIFKNNVFVNFIDPSNPYCYSFLLPFDFHSSILSEPTIGLFSLIELGFSNASMKKYANFRKQRDDLTFSLGNIYSHNIINDLYEELKYFQTKSDQSIAIRAKISNLEKRIINETVNLKTQIENMESSYTIVCEKLDYYDTLIYKNISSVSFELLETPISIEQYLKEKKENEILCELLESSFISYS